MIDLECCAIDFPINISTRDDDKYQTLLAQFDDTTRTKLELD